MLILVVDDDDFISQATQNVLAADYDVECVGAAESAIEFISHQVPDLVLLDIDMPGMNGYELCKMLRKNSDYVDMAIVFLSAMEGESERLAGYEAGGDDFLTKPVSANELRYKVERMLNNYAERKQLKTELKSTFATAMIAMSTSAEIGTVLHFLRSSFACQNYSSLCDEVCNTLVNFGLEGSVQIRGEQGTLSRSTSGVCSPLEETALNCLFGHGRLFEFSSCLSCSYEHITVIVRNIERDNPEKLGRMRDNLALLVEGADVRIEALDRDQKLVRKHEEYSLLITNTSQALHEIELQQRSQHIENEQIFQDLKNTFNLRMMTLGLTEGQEEDLSQLLQTAADRVEELYEKGLSIDVYMEKILRNLDEQE